MTPPPPACQAQHTCHATTYTWASPHAPLQFVVICLLIALVLAMWIAFAEQSAKDSE